MTAGDDLENLSAVLGEGASKLQGRLSCGRIDKPVAPEANTDVLFQAQFATISMDEECPVRIVLEWRRSALQSQERIPRAHH